MPGQINRGTPLGDLIYKLVCDPDINIIVEIGTWNGQGSTRCVIDGLKNKSFYHFLSLESSPDMYQKALKSVGVIPGVELLLGRIIEPKDIPELNLKEPQKTWLSEDIKNYNQVPNILDKIPEKIDLIIFDGGEFTSELEFHLIAPRARYIILDDTNTAVGAMKFHTVREKLLKGQTEFIVVHDFLNDRNGWIFAEKRT